MAEVFIGADSEVEEAIDLFSRHIVSNELRNMELCLNILTCRRNNGKDHVIDGVSSLYRGGLPLSVDRKNVQWKPVLWGVGLQIIIAVVVLHPTMQQFFFEAINQSVLRLLSFSEEAAHFAFGTMEPHEVVKPNA